MTWVFNPRTVTERREQLGLTRADVARKLAEMGMSKSTGRGAGSLVAMWEEGRGTPRIATAFALARVLRIGVSKLVTEVPNK